MTCNEVAVNAHAAWVIVAVWALDPSLGENGIIWCRQVAPQSWPSPCYPLLCKVFNVCFRKIHGVLSAGAGMGHCHLFG